MKKGRKIHRCYLEFCKMHLWWISFSKITVTCFFKKCSITDVRKDSKYTPLGNKLKWWISKWVFQENKAIQIFRKTNISYSLMRRPTYAYQGVRNVRFSGSFAYVLNEWSPTQKMKFFGKFGVLCFQNTCFEIRSFALLPTNWTCNKF